MSAVTPHIAITFAVIVAAMGLFVWNRVPAVVVAVCATLTLYFTGVLTAAETLSGFGDPVVIMLVGLFSIAIALEKAGVASWAGRLLLRHTGDRPRLRLVALMLVAGVLSGLMGMNGTVAALLPVAIVVAARTRTPPSKLMIPLAFACLSGAQLSMLGSPANVVTSTQIDEAGVGHVGFFDWALLGLPQLAGAIVLTLLLGDRLLPVRPAPAAAVEQSSAAPDTDADARAEARADTDAEAGEHGGAGGDSDRGAADEAEASAAPAPAPALDGTAFRAIGILALLVLLLAFNVTSPAIAAMICAALMVLARVVTVPQLARGVDWSTCILVGAMIPPAVAMTKTGAARLIGDEVVGALGGFGPVAVLAGLFFVTFVISQLISNTSSGLVMLPIGLATASDLGVSAVPMMLGVAMGASASFLTPFANAVSLMVYRPGGYAFGDFWRLGLVLTAWTMAVTLLVIPAVWRF
jgi:di/tricarboxylate transporter